MTIIMTIYVVIVSQKKSRVYDYNINCCNYCHYFTCEW